jgi:dipeptidyl aminopeptidase/acylaminoacyl peptidase
VDNPDRIVYAVACDGTWRLHARDLGRGTRSALPAAGGPIDCGIDSTGTFVWWFADLFGNELGGWRRTSFDTLVTEAIPSSAPFHPAGLALGQTVQLMAEQSERGTTVRALRSDSSTIAVHQEPAYSRLAGLSADEHFFSMVSADDDTAVTRVLDLRGQLVARSDELYGQDAWAGPWSPRAGDQRLIVHHERSGWLRPAIWSPESGETREVDLDMTGEIEATWFGSAEQLLLHQRRQGRSRLYKYHLVTAQAQEISLPEGSIEACAVRPDGAIWALHSNAGRPPQLLTDTGAAVLAAPAGPPGVSYRGQWAGDVHFFLAEPDLPRPHPTIFVLHGGPHRHDRDSYSPRVQAWVDHGFAVAMVNYRGSTGYGRNWREALRQPPGPGLTELADLAAVRSSLIAGGVADSARIVLEGGSWGGYLVLLALGAQPGLYQAGIAVVPVADWVATYEDELPAVRALNRALFGGTPAQRPEYYAERSPLSFVSHLQEPVLIIRGTHDSRCPPRQIDNYVRAMKENGKTFSFHEFEGGHGSLEAEEQIEQQELQVEFLRHHLGTRAVIG